MRANDNVQRCPGEANCEDWKAAAGDTQFEKEQAVCIGCKFFSTKHGNSDEWIEDVVNEVEYHRFSPTPPDLNEISGLVWEGLIIWKKEEFRMELEHRKHIQMLVDTLFKVR